MTDPKTPQIEDNSLKDKDLPVNGELNSIIDNIIGNRTEPKSTKFHLARMFGLSVEQAAIHSGYNKSYAHRLDHKFRNDSDIQAHIVAITSKMPEQYKAVSRLRLMQISGIEGKVLDMYDNDPSLVHDKPALFKQMKQSAGVLADDTSGPGQTTIKVDKLQVLIQGDLDG